MLTKGKIGEGPKKSRSSREQDQLPGMKYVNESREANRMKWRGVNGRFEGRGRKERKGKQKKGWASVQDHIRTNEAHESVSGQPSERD
jgi:hypothetical protein